MTEQRLTRQSWRRFHDPNSHIEKPDATINGIGTSASAIDLVRRSAGTRLTAAGSHWSLSKGTVSDGESVETNWPGAGVVSLSGPADVDLDDLINEEVFDAMVKNPVMAPGALTEDPCLSTGLGTHFFIHVKAGTRVYEAYSLFDRADVQLSSLAKRLNRDISGDENAGPYCGPWAFETLGGAGGQTVVGAFTTGTHGGDFQQSPIADSIMALHLVAEGGSHYWIEPNSNGLDWQLTDDNKLRAQYNDLVPLAEFEVIRDDDTFRAVIVGAGRFGVVVSVIVRVVPQYSFIEHRRLDSWLRVKKQLVGGNLHHVFEEVLFTGTPSGQNEDRHTFAGRFGDPKSMRSRFLQIAVNLSPDGNSDHAAGVTQRWFYPEAGPEATDPDGDLRGRKERGIEAMAGKSASYEPPDDDSKAGGNGTFLSRACASGNFVAGAVREVANEIDDIIRDEAVPATGIAVAALGLGLGPVALTIAGICAALAIVAAALHSLADEIEASGELSLAAVVDMGIKTVLAMPGIPTEIGIMALRMVFHEVFASQQSKRDYVALSYAVMDTHDYLDRSCFGNAESIEVFLDATRPDLYCAYVDAVLSFEAFQQEQKQKFSVGYVSLRYVLGSQGLIAPARFEETVVVEIAAIRDASGSRDFVMNAARVAQNRIYDATFHWGQFNPLDRAEVERCFAPGNRLNRWRDVLRRFTDDGRGVQFSNRFTRQTGLEPI